MCKDKTTVRRSNVENCAVFVFSSTAELGFNVVKLTEYFGSLQTSVVLTQECNVTVNSEELIGTTEHMTL
jgi:hypothetical protein